MCFKPKKDFGMSIMVSIIQKILDNNLGEASLDLVPYLASIKSYNKASQLRIIKLANQIEEKRARYTATRQRLQKTRRHSTN